MSASASMTLRAAATTLALLAAGSGAHARDDERAAEAARRDTEATVLFAAIIKDILADTGIPFQTCEIDAAWNRDTIDDAIAHKAVGLEVHANVANPYPIAAVSVILGASVAKDAICDTAARKREEASRTAAWETAVKALPSGSTPPESPFFITTRFSYPLFDREFRRAVLVYERDGYGLRFEGKGARLSDLIKGFGAALVYARTGDAWHKVDRIWIYGSF